MDKHALCERNQNVMDHSENASNVYRDPWAFDPETRRFKGQMGVCGRDIAVGDVPCGLIA
jgi:hypothetical protein